MENKPVSRRQFMRDGAVVAAGVAVGLGAKTTGAAPVETSKILNYNPNMEYRRQGKTNLMISAVCLGGHSRSNVEERTEIVSRAIDVGGRNHRHGRRFGHGPLQLPGGRRLLRPHLGAARYRR